jgi:predicted glycosyltransferase involved in capsule biosynthesis
MSPRWISPCQRHSYHQGKEKNKELKNNYFKNKRMNTLLEEIIVGGGKWK